VNWKTNDVLITGDTVVLCDNEVLGKPKSSEEAASMLQKLSDRSHTVASGIAVTTKSTGISSAVDTCEVTFGKLDAQADRALHPSNTSHLIRPEGTEYKT
jgi:predicted house-cleaning NTP pyrophosphatase (Maf/HAM1 superfamily)